MMRVLSVASAAFVTLAACSNNNPGNDAGADANPGKDAAGNDAAPDSSCTASASGTVSGTLLGTTLNVKDVASSSGNGVFVAFADFTGLCAVFQANNNKANSNGLVFDFLNATTFSTGTFTVPAQVDVQFATYDATCNSPQGESGSSGSVTVTSVDACKVVGTFDVTLNTDHVTGSFTAPNCATAASDGGAAGCQ
jgi:hypothetical protein